MVKREYVMPELVFEVCSDDEIYSASTEYEMPAEWFEGIMR